VLIICFTLLTKSVILLLNFSTIKKKKSFVEIVRKPVYRNSGFKEMKICYNDRRLLRGKKKIIINENAENKNRKGNPDSSATN
jgi:hypothetical protein